MPSLNPGGSVGFPGAPFMGYRAGLVYPLTSRGMFAGTGGTLTADQLCYVPYYVQENVTFIKTHVHQQASSAGNMRVGWYTRDTTQAYHIGTKHIDLGVIAFDTGTGVRTLTSSVTLTRGWWFFAYTQDAALRTTYETAETNAASFRGLAGNEFGHPVTLSAVTGAWASNARVLVASRAYAALPTTPTAPDLSLSELMPFFAFEP